MSYEDAANKFIRNIKRMANEPITNVKLEVVSIIHTPVGDNTFYKMFGDAEDACQNYKVQYTVTIEYDVKAVGMDAAEAEAHEQLINDLYIFGDDRIKLVKRAVIETLDGN